VSKVELPDEWRRLAEESLGLSGISEGRIDSSLRARHFEAALILSRATQFVDPRLVNGVLTGRKGKWYRDGIASNLRGKAPAGELVSAFMEMWVRDVETGLVAAKVKGREWTKKKRAEFALIEHYRICLMRPFKEANGRTAHLMLNHIRVLLGLPVYIVRFKDEREYYKRQNKYRRDVFIPWMRKQSKILKEQSLKQNLIIQRRLAFAELCRDKKI
jgi:hypothetical protein